MHFKGRMELEYGLKQIDIAPLVNIIFLLLTFLMLSASFVMQPGIKISLPRALTSEAIRQDNIELLISADSLIYINNKPISLDELKPFFKQLIKRNLSILIKADKNASFAMVVQVWDLARNLGIKQINIATNQ